MYYINYGSFDYGQGRFGRLSRKLRLGTQKSNLVRTQSLLSPLKSSLMFATPTSFKRSTRLSVLPNS